jgi:WD40 repeat protein
MTRASFFMAIILVFVSSTFVFSQTAPEQIGTTEIINAVFSPDSSMLAIKVPNGIHLYDPNSLLTITFIETISSLSVSNFSPDGTLFASGGKDNSLIIMDVKSRSELATLTGHTSKVSCVSFSPDGSLLASGSEDGTVKLWDAKTRLGVATFTGHTGKIVSLGFSANGRFLISNGFDNALKLWDPKTYQELATLKGRLDWMLSPNFMPDMTLVSKRRAFTETLKLNDLRFTSPNVLAGDTTTIEALSIYSGDGTALKHLWTTNAGAIQGSGSKATYRAPEKAGTYSINVRATDGAISSERTAEISVEQGTSESSIPLANNAHWPAQALKDKLSYNINVTRIPGTKVILHFDITQDNDKFDSFLSIEIGQKVILQDMAVGNEQPSTGVRTMRDIDITDVIKEPGTYIVTFYMRPGDRMEKGWLMNEARIIGVEGSAE